MQTDRYRNDIVSFAESEYYLVDTGKPIELMDHQKRILRDVLTRDSDGRFPYQTVVFSCVKKSGKTEIGGLVAAWYALTEGKFNEIYTPANDEEQSQGRVFRAAARAMQGNPRMQSVKVTQNTITFPNGSEIRALASEYAGVAGANPGLTIWDELWAYTTERSRRLWDELTPVPTRKNSLRFIFTYAGFENESKLLEELYLQGLAGERLYDDLPVWVNGSLYMYWDTEPRMPWQTPEYYEEQSRQLRPMAFQRMHQNQWVSTESQFIEAAEWDALVGADMAPYPDPTDRPVIIGLDASKSGRRGSDTTAAVAVRREGEVTRLIAHKIWKPDGKSDIDLRASVLPWLLDLKKRYASVRIFYDPYNMSTVSQIGKEAGLRMTELPQTPGRQTEFTGALLDMVRSGTLRVYQAPDLREQVLSSVMIETVRGVRLAKERASRKIDGAVALAMACWGAQKLGRDVPPPVVHDYLSFKGGAQRAIPEQQRDILETLYGKNVPSYAIDKT